jgi:hypothetical protein
MVNKLEIIKYKKWSNPTDITERCPNCGNNVPGLSTHTCEEVTQVYQVEALEVFH